VNDARAAWVGIDINRGDVGPCITKDWEDISAGRIYSLLNGGNRPMAKRLLLLDYLVNNVL
jgi:hypothetical protein